MTIRDFTPDDYQAISDLQCAVFEDLPSVPEDWIEADARRDPKCKHHRWVVETDGKIVAVGQYDQFVWAYHPQRFALMLRVHPDYRGRGIGTALYEHILAALEPHDPIGFRATLREDHSEGMRFAEKHGFEVHIRDQRSALDPATFDPAPYAALEARLDAAGLTLKSFAELASDPQRNRKMYELDMEVTPDVPGTDDFTPPSFENYLKDVIEQPMLLHDISFVAVAADGEYVGLTSLWGDRASDMYYTGFTAVKRPYRRQGVATALKVRAIMAAQERNCPRINTDNAETNPMLQLNYRLGFRPLPAWITYKKTIRDGA